MLFILEYLLFRHESWQIVLLVNVVVSLLLVGALFVSGTVGNFRPARAKAEVQS